MQQHVAVFLALEIMSIRIPKYPRRILEHGMGFEPMNNGFAGRRVSHFATRARMGLFDCCPKTRNPLLLAVGSTETKDRSIKPECQNKRVRNSNRRWRNRRSSGSGSS
jgi:hypothetical protein